MMMRQQTQLYIGPCTVCIVLDHDTSEKLVSYCAMCDAYLCDRCRSDMGRRARAFLAMRGWMKC
jgi:hypothetical protein